MTRQEAEALGWEWLDARDPGPAGPGSGRQWLEGSHIAEKRLSIGLTREMRGTALDLLEAIEVRELEETRKRPR